MHKAKKSPVLVDTNISDAQRISQVSRNSSSPNVSITWDCFFIHHITVLSYLTFPLTSPAFVYFIALALTLKEKTRAELHRNVDADYYGYRDEEDGTLLEFEEEQERIGTLSSTMILLFLFFETVILVISIVLILTQSSSLCCVLAMEKALEQAEEADEDAMEVDGEQGERPQALGTLYVPSQKEVEEYLVKRRKQAILDRYVNEDLVKTA